MKRIACVVASVFSAAGYGQDPTKAPKLEMVGISVTRKIEDSPPEKYPLREPRTALTLAFQIPGKEILLIDAASKVTEFKDDKGNELKDRLFPVQFDSFVFSHSKDRSKAMTTVQAGAAPAPGSVRVTLKGELILHTGHDEKMSEARPLLFQKDQSLALDAITLKVIDDKGPSIRLAIESANPVVKKILVTNDAGKDMRIALVSPSQTKTGWTYTAFLNQKLDKGSVRVVYLAKHEKVTIPVDLAFGLGF